MKFDIPLNKETKQVVIKPRRKKSKLKIIIKTFHLKSKNKWHISVNAHGIMVIVVGNGHKDTSANPGRD